MARGNGGDINEGSVMGLWEGDAGEGRGRPVIQTIDKNSVSVSLVSLFLSVSHYRRRGSDAANIRRGGKGGTRGRKE